MGETPSPRPLRAGHNSDDSRSMVPTVVQQQVETATETRNEQGCARVIVPSAAQSEPDAQPGLDMSVHGTWTRGTTWENSEIDLPLPYTVRQYRESLPVRHRFSRSCVDQSRISSVFEMTQKTGGSM